MMMVVMTVMVLMMVVVMMMVVMTIMVLMMMILLPCSPGQDAEAVLKELMPHLTPVWPRMVETLSKSSAWDAIRCLVLGPPEKLVDKSAVPAGWKFADRYKEGRQHKVCLWDRSAVHPGGVGLMVVCVWVEVNVRFLLSMTRWAVSHGLIDLVCCFVFIDHDWGCLLYTSPSPRDISGSRMPSSA